MLLDQKKIDTRPNREQAADLPCRAARDLPEKSQESAAVASPAAFWAAIGRDRARHRLLDGDIFITALRIVVVCFAFFCDKDVDKLIEEKEKTLSALQSRQAASQTLFAFYGLALIHALRQYEKPGGAMKKNNATEVDGTTRRRPTASKGRAESGAVAPNHSFVQARPESVAEASDPDATMKVIRLLSEGNMTLMAATHELGFSDAGHVLKLMRERGAKLYKHPNHAALKLAIETATQDSPIKFIGVDNKAVKHA